jgi:hypothetical protein
MRRQAGITLLEVLIAVSLLTVLSVGMMMAMRIGISALSKVDKKLMENRRVAGAQRLVEQELQGIVPIMAPCGARGMDIDPASRVVIFSGQSNSITMVSSFSLQEAWRGRPQLLQIFTSPADDGGMRLVVNEIPYTGLLGVGRTCTGVDRDPDTFLSVARFPVPTAGPSTFVLADHLQLIRFSYLNPARRPGEQPQWIPVWNHGDWPTAIRIEMVPLNPNPARLQPITVTAPIYLDRKPGVKYDDR